MTGRLIERPCSSRMAERPREVLAEQIRHLSSAIDRLADTAKQAQTYLAGVEERLEDGEPLLALVSDPTGLAIRTAIYDAVQDFQTQAAELRGMFFEAAWVHEKVSLSALERATGIKRQTIAGLIGRLRRRLER